MKKSLCWLILAFVALVQPSAFADALKLGNTGPQPFGQSAVEFLPVEEAYQLYPRRDGNTLVLEWVLAPGYYLYQERFGAAISGGTADGKTLPLNFTKGVVRYDDYYEKDVEVYYETTTVTGGLDATIIDGVIQVESQACADAGLCYPPRTLYIPLTAGAKGLEVLTSAPEQVTNNTPTPDSSLLVILGFAVLGGLLLNLMPCVFPILSIKVLSLSQSHLSKHGRHIHGLAYSAGVVVSFLTVALLLIVLRAGGQALGWGFQLQSPGFITALVFLFFLMGFGFSGYFEAGTRLMNLGQSASSGHGLHHSFLTGVLATVVASPCSAPFMGTALGFALTQQTFTALLVFAALGVGMALPFLILTWVPKLLDSMPRPGPWMDNLKKFLAFPLYLTAIWLLWILGNQTGSDTVAIVLCGLVLLAMAIWLGQLPGGLSRLLAVVLAVVALALPIQELVIEKEKPIWQAYSPEKLDDLLDRRQAVFINLTADWCITCLANEKIALSSDGFKQALADGNIVYLKGDWTHYDADITTLLNAHRRSGVPLYLFYAAGQRNPVVLPQILSPAIVRDAFGGNL